MTPLVAHADWSMAPAKRWMTVAVPEGAGWRVRTERVGDVATLLNRLGAEADGAPVGLGLDLPIGVPLAYAERHATGFADFPAFLAGLADNRLFFDVCRDLAEVSPTRPFFPHQPIRGMTRQQHADQLGITDRSALYRRCDKKTLQRPAASPLFWTLGASQVGKAALSAWRDLLLPAQSGADRALLWPFDGPLRTLLRPGAVAIAETYPAQALRQLGLTLNGSKRSQASRQALVPGLHERLHALDAHATPDCQRLIDAGFGADAAGEDRFDSLLGLVAMLQVVRGEVTDEAPADPAIQRWEGWILGQTE